MTLNLALGFAVLFISVGTLAQTTQTDLRSNPSRCSDLLISAPLPPNLPNPFSFDPRDLNAILRFIDQTAPFPKLGTEHGMTTSLAMMWKKFRPDLSDTMIQDRLDIFETSAHSLQQIVRPIPSARLEKGRLLIAWLRFLRDVGRPGDPFPAASNDEIAWALMLPLKRSNILSFLRKYAQLQTATPARIDLALNSFASRHGLNPNIAPAPLPAPATPLPPDQSLESRWQAVLACLDQPITFRRSGRSPENTVIPYRQLPKEKAQLDRILAYLRPYGAELKVDAPATLIILLERLRREYRLSPRPALLNMSDSKKLSDSQDQGPAQHRLRAAWAQFTRDKRDRKIDRRKRAEKTLVPELLISDPDSRLDPLAIDPEDESSILNYVASLAPGLDRDVPFGLREALMQTWSIHRPDLTATEISKRIYLYDSSAQALRRLHGEASVRRFEMGRLRLTWLALLHDIAPHHVIPAEAFVRHKARALMVHQNEKAILDFLGEELGVPVPRNVLAVQKALADLYQKKAGKPYAIRTRGRPRPRGKGTTIAILWNDYLIDLTDYINARVATLPRSTMRYQHRLEMPAEPVHVPREERWILEYLTLRYPTVDPTKPDSLNTLLKIIYTGYGLSLPHLRFGPDAFEKILRHHDAEDIRALLEIWDHLVTSLSTAD